MSTLSDIFVKYFQETSTQQLDPMPLRKEISKKSKLFELGRMADSAEVLVFILSEIHKTKVEPTREDSDYISCNESCSAHECFNLQCLEQITCNCSREVITRPWNYSSFTFPVHVDELLEAAAKLFDDDLLKFVGKLEQCYPKSVKKEMCTLDPSKCKEATCEYNLLVAPKVLLLSLVGKWESVRRESKTLKLLALFPAELPISAIFPGQNQERYRLKAWIAFSFNHYVAFVRCSNSQEWVKYNDTTITSYPTFAAALRELTDREFHPTLLCYELIQPDDHGPKIEMQESDWSALQGKFTSRLKGSESLPVFTDSTALFGKGLWMCKGSGCFWCNENTTEVCTKCGAPKNSKPGDSEVKGVSISTALDVGKTHSISSALLRGERPKMCDKCRRNVPNKGQCVCTRFLIPHKTAGHFVCPKCRLIMEGESSLCENCGAILRLLKFCLNCAKCAKAIETKGHCRQCEIDVEASPCPFCGFSEVVCYPCKI